MPSELKPEMIPAEAVLWLAELEKPCDSCNGSLSGTGPDRGCIHCGGSGKVLVLPDLQQSCPWCQGEGQQCLGIPQNPADIHCQGRGWLPKPGLDVLHQAMTKAGFSQLHAAIVGQPEERHYYWPSGRGLKSSDCREDDHLAAAAALKKAGYA